MEEIYNIFERNKGLPLRCWDLNDVNEIKATGYKLIELQNGRVIMKEIHPLIEDEEPESENKTEVPKADLSKKLCEPFSVKLKKHEKRLDPNTLETILKEFKKLDDSLDNDDDAEKYNPINTLIGHECWEFLFDLGHEDEHLENNTSSIGKYYWDNISDRFEDLLWKFELEPVIKNITGERIQELNTELNKFYSKITDTAELKKEHLKNVESFGVDKLKKIFTTYIVEIYGLDDLCEKIKEEQDLSRIGNMIRKYNLDNTLAKKRALKYRGKNKIRYDLALEELKDMKSDLKLIAGHFDPTFENFKSASSKTKKIRKLIDRLDYETEDFVQFKIDTRYNRDVDLDAGSVSGDCTRTDPLPFDYELVHNVKIHNGGNKHIGNIYVLEDPDLEVLHLEAVQIPSFNERTTTEFMNQFLPELYAKYNSSSEKNTTITINQDREHMSNYEEISSAMIKLIPDREKLKNFTYPNISNAHFQGGKPGEITNKSVLFEKK